MFEEILEPIGQQIAASRAARGPQEVQIHRAGGGTGLTVSCIWWGYVVLRTPQAHPSIAQVMTGKLPQATWIAALCWLLILVTGLLLLITGTARARGTRDVMVAAKACVWIAGAGALLWTQAFVAGEPFINGGLLTAYIWTLASGLTRLYLALRGMPRQSLPDPEGLGLPVSGPASRREAAEGMSGNNDWNPPRFRD